MSQKELTHEDLENLREIACDGCKGSEDYGESWWDCDCRDSCDKFKQATTEYLSDEAK